MPIISQPVSHGPSPPSSQGYAGVLIGPPPPGRNGPSTYRGPIATPTTSTRVLPPVVQSAEHFNLYGNRTQQQVLDAGHAVETWRDQQTGQLIAQPSAWQQADMGRDPWRYSLLASPQGAGPGLVVLGGGGANSVVEAHELEAALLAAGFPPNYDGPAQLDDGSWVWVSP